MKSYLTDIRVSVWEFAGHRNKGKIQTIRCSGLSLFADPQDENKIGIDGIQKFCDDLALDPASISILVVAWKFRAATQCEFSKKEFIEGMVDLG